MAEALTTITGRLRFARALKDTWGKLEIDTSDDEAKRVIHTVMCDGVQNYAPLVGLAFEVKGVASMHPTYGSQIKARAVVVLKPRTRAEFRSWLIARFLLRYASMTEFLVGIADLVEDKTFFQNALLRLRDFDSEAYDKAREFIDIDFTTLAEVKSALIGRGMSEWMADKAVAEWKEAAPLTIEQDPYRLMDIDGVGFKRADPVARDLYKIALDDPRRVRALFSAVIKEFESDGHTYAGTPTFVARLREMGIPQEVLEISMSDAWEGKNRFVEMFKDVGGKDIVQSAATHFDETNLATGLVIKAELSGAEIYRAPSTTSHGLDLSLDQQKAVALAVTGASMIITGFPGSGKTTVIRAIIDAIRAHAAERGTPRIISLAAPTGKAARRMVEAVGHEAHTLHRLLGKLAWWKMLKSEDGYNHHVMRAEGGCQADVLIVDEASMLDTALAERVVFACRGSSQQIIFVGDTHQLPSVGQGAVLRDLILSGIWPSVHLSKVFRAGEGSWVLRNAPVMARGDMPDLEPTDDFAFYAIDDASEARRVACEAMADGLRSGVDTQLLAPQRTKELGVAGLNAWCKNLVNPRDDEWKISGEVAVGLYDLVIQTTNNYDKGVFNGETGQIRDVTKKALVVHFDDGTEDGRPVVYSRSDAFDLQLAYALTVHKSQGSEWRRVIFIAHPQHSYMLERKLIYTAVTRAREHLTIIGSRQALRRGLGNVRDRSTLLQRFIAEAANAR